jgi:hypothetical protein
MRNDDIDTNFAMPAALLEPLNWNEVRNLRLRSQVFTGNSLVHMGLSYGLHSTDPIPADFEINWSLDEITQRTQHWMALTRDLDSGLILRAPNILGETGWWVPGSRWLNKPILVNIDVIDYQERINLIALGGLVGRFRKKKPRILEIGGGYGALSLALRRIMNPSQYVICDLPESSLFSGCIYRWPRIRQSVLLR